MVPWQTCCILLILVAIAPLHRECICAEDASANFTSLVAELDDQAFHARRRAASALVTAGTSFNQDVAASVNEVLQQGLQHPSLEVRIAAAEIFRQIQQIRLDRQMACLLNPRCQTSSLRLPGWDTFSKLAGDDMPARRLYARTFARYPKELRELEAGYSKQSTERLAGKIDPYRLPHEDAAGWTMLLLLDIEGPKTPVSSLTSRLAMALGNSAMGPRTNREPCATVLQRLIDHWIRVHQNNCAMRDRLLIAMRYGCHNLASELCDQIFSDPSASPSTVVTALLSASTLGRSDIESQAKGRLDDDRTAHVWQLIATRKTKIRTQVCDVALALLLHRRGVDPRSAGFDELQADPLLTFRDHSLGFPDEASRRKTFETALHGLSSTDAE